MPDLVWMQLKAAAASVTLGRFTVLINNQTFIYGFKSAQAWLDVCDTPPPPTSSFYWIIIMTSLSSFLCSYLPQLTAMFYN